MAAAIAAITAIVGYSNGWFQTKLESLHNTEDKADLELRTLDNRRSALQTEVANLKTDRDNLNEKLAATLSQADRLAAKYKDAARKAAQGEHYHHDLDEIRKQLQASVTEANAAKAAADAAKWRNVLRQSCVDTNQAKVPHELHFAFSRMMLRLLLSNVLYKGAFKGEKKRQALHRPTSRSSAAVCGSLRILCLTGPTAGQTVLQQLLRR